MDIFCKMGFMAEIPCCKKKMLWAVLAFLPILLVFYLLRTVFGFQIQYAQISIFPFLLCWLFYIGIKGKLFPLKLILVSALFAVAVFLIPYLSFNREAVFVATLVGDDIENESREFWSELNKLLKYRGVVSSKRFYRVYKNHQEALSSQRTIIWGDQKWINLSFVEVPHHQILGFTLIGGVSRQKIPYQPRIDTAKFLAAFLSGLKEINADGSFSGYAEQELHYAASRNTLWISGEHKALPLLLLGNGYLQKAFKDGNFQAAYLECAISVYSRALLYSNKKTDPELSIALYNNLAVALHLKGIARGSKNFRQLAQKTWGSAINLRKVQKMCAAKKAAIKVARKNLAIATSKRKELKKKGKLFKKKKRNLKKSKTLKERSNI
ncbi:MAG: hypothetical protein ACOX2O_08615 [Bdellovibrionota bacterium]|jgi:hypothetical protein